MRIQHLGIRGIAVGLYLASVISYAADSDIRLNSLGFFPDQKKQATVAAAGKQFSIIRLNDLKIVFTGTLTGPFHNEDTKETVYTADFSALTETGEYRLQVEEIGASAPFKIERNVYNDAFHTVMKGMYLWRCGSAVSATHNGIRFSHEACHLEDAYLDYVGEKGARKDGTKGWHDAGDYNKYVVNAGVTVGAMFMAWEHFPAIRAVKLDLPESEQNNTLPDFLDEMKWEIEWLLTMQAGDGSVYHKISTRNFGGFILPELEKERRYFVTCGSAATADFTAMLAMAGRIFEPYDPAFADECKTAALKSYRFLLEHPDNRRPNQQGFTTGGYDTSDPDDRLWAAAEMWETFGDESYRLDFERRINAFENLVDINWDWSNVKNLGIVTYLLSERDSKDPAIRQRLRDDLLQKADSIVKTGKAHGYARPLGARYYWGCNGTVARQVIHLMAAYRLSNNPEYIDTSLAALDHLFGRNYYNRSFITGLGHNPPMHPHDRRSGGDSIRDPWPGYLVGGGHSGVDWVDIQDSYQTNEIAINWNGALIYALAAFVRDDSPSAVPKNNE